MVKYIMGYIAMGACFIFLMLVAGLLDRPLKHRRKILTEREVEIYFRPPSEYMKGMTWEK